MTDITLPCWHCNRETTYDLARVLRGLTLADVREYLKPAAPTPKVRSVRGHFCIKCHYYCLASTMQRPRAAAIWTCLNQTECSERAAAHEARKLATEKV